MNPPDLYANLKQSVAAGRLCAFVGAGLSMGAGLPGWYQIISELCVRIGYELPPQQWATGEVLIEAAQAYVNKQSLFDLVVFLKDRLDTIRVKPSAAHLALARLPISFVFTANYDDLLERAFRAAGKRVEVVTRDIAIPFVRGDRDTVNIVKLYGDLGQPDTIVLARQQYESFFLERPQMLKLLETQMTISDMLYLGWGHSDPYFNQIFGEVLSRFRGFMRTGYAVMFDVPLDRQRELGRKHIRVVDLPSVGDRTAELAAWLDSLVAA